MKLREHSLISQNSSVESHKVLLQHLSDILCGSSLFLWVSRVPSASNPADETFEAAV